MKNLKKVLCSIGATLTLVFCVFALASCSDNDPTGAQKDQSIQNGIANDMASNQPTPTDIEYSLERYNLIRRAYWVNGLREKAIALPCEIQKPLGYIYLISHGTVVGQFTVDGKVTSLAKYLTPDYRVVEKTEYSYEKENADTDGCYGNETTGIFWFTTDGKYCQWSGEYFYSDIPFELPNTVLEQYN
jgi:hypothetical protein